MNQDVTELSVEGTEYRDVDGYTFIFVADGIAFGETTSVEGGYYVSLGPYALDDLGDGEPATWTLYRAGSTLYIADTHDGGACLSIPDYDIAGELWNYDGSSIHNPRISGEESREATEYIRFSSHHSEDMLLTRDECETRLKTGDIRQLWPVWRVGHR